MNFETAKFEKLEWSTFTKVIVKKWYISWITVCIKPCPHWRLSPFSATVAEIGDYSRQCGQGFTVPGSN